MRCGFLIISRENILTEFNQHKSNPIRRLGHRCVFPYVHELGDSSASVGMTWGQLVIHGMVKWMGTDGRATYRL